MRDAQDYHPCPDRPDHWVKVVFVPEEIVDYGPDQPQEIRPAHYVPLDDEICGKVGQSLEDLIAELNAGEWLESHPKNIEGTATDITNQKAIGNA